MKTRLKKCRYCGSDIAKNANVCPNCGANLVMMKPGVIVGIVLWIAAIIFALKAFGTF